MSSLAGPFVGPDTDVVVCEAWPRDGIQGWPDPIPTDRKLAVLDLVLRAGVREVDATSFVPARTSPQFFDAADVLAALASRPDVTVRVLAVNVRSVQDAARVRAETGAIDVCGFPISASESHNLANLRRGQAEHKRALEEMIALCFDSGLEPLLAVATAFGCPIEGVVPEAAVLELAEWAYQRGVRRLMLGDTTGVADPAHAWSLFTAARAALPDATWVAHFHDTRGSGIANTLAALAAGVRVVDASLGGTGGEPASVEIGQRGLAGNVATEDLVSMLNRMGVRTGIDLDLLLEAGQAVIRAHCSPLHSAVQQAGPPPPRG
jgi:hydroxymethylglutaryl-CoA lyase